MIAVLFFAWILAQNPTSAGTVSGRFASAERPTSVVLRTSAANPNAAPAGETSVNPDGTFNFAGIATGIYVVQLGRTPSSRTTNAFRVDNSGVRLVVITGQMTIDDGSALPSFTLPNVGVATSIEDRGTAPGGVNPAVLASLAIPADGLIAMALPEGDHRIGVRNLPLPYDVKSMAIGNRELPGGNLSVSMGMPSGELRIGLTKTSTSGVRVTGRASGQFGDAGTSSTVLLQGIEPGSHATSTTPKSDGSFEFTGVPAGIYGISLRVRRPAGTPVVNPGFWWVRVGDQNIRGIEFPVRIESRTLDGAAAGTPITVPEALGRLTVVDENGGPKALPAGVMIGLSGNPPSLTSVAPDGAFAMPVGNGDHSIVFFSLPSGYSIRTMSSGSIDLLRFPLAAMGNDAPAEIRIAVQFDSRDAAEGRSRLTNGRISGRILSADGSAVSNVRVSALSSPSLLTAPVASTVTDSEGHYSFENLAPGQYYFVVGSAIATATRVVTRHPNTPGVATSDFLPVSIAYGQQIDLGSAVSATEAVGRGQPTAVYMIQTPR